MNKQHDPDDLEQMAPTLHRLKGRDPIRVPGNFFEHFPHAIQMKVADGEGIAPSTSIWLRRLAWSLPMAAMVVLALLLWRPDGASGEATHQVADTQGSWWDLFDDELLYEAVYEEGTAPTPITLELDDDEWLAYWEDQDMLDIYLELEPQ
jgi:hypothetical protein